MLDNLPIVLLKKNAHKIHINLEWLKQRFNNLTHLTIDRCRHHVKINS